MHTLIAPSPTLGLTPALLPAPTLGPILALLPAPTLGLHSFSGDPWFIWGEIAHGTRGMDDAWAARDLQREIGKEASEMGHL